MQILEWSDTQLTFHITQTEWSTTTNVDLTQYDKIILTISLWWVVLDIEWEIDWQDSSKIIFDLLSEQTKWRCWWVQADIWWLKDAEKIRFNLNTIQGNVLHSIKVPEWTTDL